MVCELCLSKSVRKKKKELSLSPLCGPSLCLLSIPPLPALWCRGTYFIQRAGQARLLACASSLWAGRARDLPAVGRNRSPTSTEPGQGLAPGARYPTALSSPAVVLRHHLGSGASWAAWMLWHIERSRILSLRSESVGVLSSLDHF